MTSTASSHRPFTTVRDQYLASLSSGAPTVIDTTTSVVSESQKQQEVLKPIGAHVRSSYRSRSVSPIPKFRPSEITNKSVPSAAERFFSKSPIRGEIVGRLSASYEPSVVPPPTNSQNNTIENLMDTHTRSAFQSSRSAYTNTTVLSSSSSSVSPKNGNIQNKTVTMGQTQAHPPTSLLITKQPLLSPKLLAHSNHRISADPPSNQMELSSNKIDSCYENVALLSDETVESSLSLNETDANITPSVIRARNNNYLSGLNTISSSPSPSHTLKPTNKTSPSMILHPVPARKSKQVPVTNINSPKTIVVHRQEDEGTNASRSSIGSTYQTHSLLQIEKNNSMHATKTHTASSISNELMHFSFSKSSPLANDLKKQESTPKSDNIPTAPPTPNRHHSSVKGSNTSAPLLTHPEIQNQVVELHTLKKEMEDRMKVEIKQLEARLERQYNQRFEQMEAKVHERLQQIRSSLQEFLVVAESEGIYRDTGGISTSTVYNKK